MILRPGRLVGIGSVVGRLTVTVPDLPSKGGEVVALGLRIQAGGAYVPLASAVRLGLPAVLCGRVGDGPFAHLIRAAMQRDAVASLLDFVTGEQGFSVCAVELDGDRTFISAPGVESQLSADDLATVAVRPDDAILVQGYDLVSPKTGDTLSRWCADPDNLGAALLAFDPGSLIADIPDHVLDRVLARTDVLLLDPRELSLLTGKTAEAPPAEAAASLVGSLAPGAIVLIRQLGSGSWLVGEDRPPRHFPGQDGDTVDGSISRDVFTAAFLAELSREGDVETAARHATVAASLTTIPISSNRSVIGPSRVELDAALAELDAVGPPPPGGPDTEGST